MASVKKKVLRFKNTPVKKEQNRTKKREVRIPVKVSNVPQNALQSKNEEIGIVISHTPVTAPVLEEKKSEETQKTFVEIQSAKAPSTSDVFLKSAFEKHLKMADYFPRISRVITERWFLIGLVCGILLVGISIVAGNIQANIQERKDLEQKREKIKHEVTYWQENAQKYPGDKDTYFQLAVLEYQLGDAQSSQSYLNKVESLDPNFQDAYTLEKILKGSK